MADPDLQISGAGGKGWSPKNFVWPLGPQFGLKINKGGGGRGGGASQDPALDQPPSSDPNFY